MRDYTSKILIIICVMVFCGSGYFLLSYVKDNSSADKAMKEVAKTRNNGLVDVYAQNNDLIGWVKIDGTKINYPVMQTVNDPEYYLHRNFKKEGEESGTPFLDANSTIAGATISREGEIADESSWNWLVYGHHMKYGTMFHDLLKFDDPTFWADHKTFKFDVIQREQEGSIREATGTYEIIAAAYSKIYPMSSGEFKYYSYGGYYDETSFNEFLEGIKSESAYETGVTAQYGDQLVTLSTCAYQTEDGRFYIVGKKVR